MVALFPQLYSEAPDPTGLDEQAQTALSLITAHRDLAAAIERAESVKNSVQFSAPVEAPAMRKVIIIDGKRSIAMTHSVEEIMEIVRALYGRNVALKGASEIECEGETLLELSFERPAEYSLTKALASYNVF